MTHRPVHQIFLQSSIGNKMRISKKVCWEFYSICGIETNRGLKIKYKKLIVWVMIEIGKIRYLLRKIDLSSEIYLNNLLLCKQFFYLQIRLFRPERVRKTVKISVTVKLLQSACEKSHEYKYHQMPPSAEVIPASCAVCRKRSDFKNLPEDYAEREINASSNTGCGVALDFLYTFWFACTV